MRRQSNRGNSRDREEEEEREEKTNKVKEENNRKTRLYSPPPPFPPTPLSHPIGRPVAMWLSCTVGTVYPKRTKARQIRTQGSTTEGALRKAGRALN